MLMPVEVDDIVVVVICCQDSGQSISRQDARSGWCRDGGVDVMSRCRCQCGRQVLSMVL